MRRSSTRPTARLPADRRSMVILRQGSLRLKTDAPALEMLDRKGAHVDHGELQSLGCDVDRDLHADVQLLPAVQNQSAGPGEGGERPAHPSGAGSGVHDRVCTSPNPSLSTWCEAPGPT